MKPFFRLLHFISFLIFISCAKPTPPYNLIPQNSNTKSLLIGLHALDENTVWASGTNATVIRTTDGGEHWESYQYNIADTLQFRDIHSIDQNSAFVLSIGNGSSSQIFHFSIDTGWTKLYQAADSAVFLDAFDFWDGMTGIVYGDAIDSLPYILKTVDGGKNWERLTSGLPASGAGEGGFASSGTLVETGPDGQAWIGTGAGGNARILYTKDYGKTWEAYPTPMVKEEAAGITSVRYANGTMFIAGGDLANADAYPNRTFFSTTNGKAWYPTGDPKTPGAFYGSAFAKVSDKNVVIICGPKGADISLDLGQSWEKISPQTLWTADLLPSGIGWIMGKGGKVLKVEIDF